MKNNKTNTLLEYFLKNQNLGIIPNPDLLLNKRNELNKAQSIALEKGKKLSPNSRIIKEYKSLLPNDLPLSLFSTLVGHILGDASIKYKKSNDNTASIAFEWANLEYAQSVYQTFYDYILSSPRTQVRISPNGKEVTTYCFQTMTLPCFAVFRDLFILNGVKSVPVGLITNFLDANGLARWYIDDGGLTDYRKGHGKGLQFNTQNFTQEEVAQMVKELNEKFNLDCWMRILSNKGNKPIIVVPSKSYPKFYNLVNTKIHKSMIHKLPSIS